MTSIIDEFTIIQVCVPEKIPGLCQEWEDDAVETWVEALGVPTKHLRCGSIARMIGNNENGECEWKITVRTYYSGSTSAFAYRHAVLKRLPIIKWVPDFELSVEAEGFSVGDIVRYVGSDREMTVGDFRINEGAIEAECVWLDFGWNLHRMWITVENLVHCQSSRKIAEGDDGDTQ